MLTVPNMHSTLLENYIVEFLVFGALDTIATQEIQKRFQADGGMQGHNFSAVNIDWVDGASYGRKLYEFLGDPYSAFEDYEQRNSLRKNSHGFLKILFSVL